MYHLLWNNKIRLSALFLYRPRGTGAREEPAPERSEVNETSQFCRHLLEKDKSSTLVFLLCSDSKKEKTGAGVPRPPTVIDFSLLIMIVIHLSSLLPFLLRLCKDATASPGLKWTVETMLE